jgi:hypothetical protein
MWNIISVRLKTMLVLEQDWCTVCANHTIGSEIILDATDETPRDVGHVESHFGPFGDNVRVGAR